MALAFCCRRAAAACALTSVRRAKSSKPLVALLSLLLPLLLLLLSSLAKQLECAFACPPGHAHIGHRQLRQRARLARRTRLGDCGALGARSRFAPAGWRSTTIWDWLRAIRKEVCSLASRLREKSHQANKWRRRRRLPRAPSQSVGHERAGQAGRRPKRLFTAGTVRVASKGGAREQERLLPA